MNLRLSRRTVLKGAATQTAALAAGRVVSFPAVVEQVGSKERVVYWGSLSGRNGELEQQLIRQFNESQSDVEVEYQFQGDYATTANKLTAALQAQQAPDVTLLSSVWWFRFYVNGVLAPLNGLMEGAGVDAADYADALYAEGVRDGTSYWLPFARSAQVFYYNKDVWAAAGLPDRGPETWGEFLDWVPRIVGEEGGPPARSALVHPSGNPDYLTTLFQGVVWQFGGRYSDPDFTMRIAEPDGIEAGTFYRSSTADGWATMAVDMNADFMGGATAAMMATSAALGPLTQDAPFEVGVAFLPKEEEQASSTGGSGLSILATSSPQKQEAAFRLVSYLTSPEITSSWSQATGYLPVRKSAAQSPELRAFYERNPSFRTAVDALPHTRPSDVAAVFVPGGTGIIGGGLEQLLVNAEETEPTFRRVAEELGEAATPVLEALAAGA